MPTEADYEKLSQSQDPAKLRRALSHWYRASHRKMPWRQEPGTLSPAYHTLLSEIMLQQTQVATVIDYFHRFLKRFPNLQSLADAEEADVLTLWQGLGYYRRARNLHKAVRVIRDELNGKIPEEMEALCKLPGIGRYTGGAIASIAFGKRVPVLDGNVMRILARIYGIDSPVDETKTSKVLWSLAEDLLPHRNTPTFTMGDMNQSLMELGATVCTPRVPKCQQCPVSKQCVALHENRVEELPQLKPKAKQKEVTHLVLGVIATVDDKPHILAQQRPEDGLWSNMWAPLTYESKSVKMPQLPNKLLSSLSTSHCAEIARFSHMTTHRKITFVVQCLLSLEARNEENLIDTISKQTAGTLHWLPPQTLAEKPMSNPHRKSFNIILEALTSSDQD